MTLADKRTVSIMISVMIISTFTLKHYVAGRMLDGFTRVMDFTKDGYLLKMSPQFFPWESVD